MRDGQGADLSVGRPRLRALGLGFAFALLTAASYEPIGWWWVALVAPAPLMVAALRPGVSGARAGMYAALGVAPWWAFAHIWTVDVSRAGIYPLTVYLALYAWAFVWIAGAVVRGAPRVPAAVALAVVWTGVEFLRGSVVMSGYGFYLTSHPLIESPGAVLAAPARFVGACGVSALVALIAGSAAGALVLRRRAFRSGLVTVGVAAFGFAVSAIAIGEVPKDAPSTRFAVVQSNIPQNNRMAWTFRQRVSDWARLRDLTLAALGSEPGVVVWPEGLVPGRAVDPASLAVERASDAVWPMDPAFEGDAPELSGVPAFVHASSVVDELLVMQRASGVPMIVGAAAYDGFRIERTEGGLRYAYDRMYNSAFVVSGGRAQTPWYDKLHLAPFGEVMPIISRWEWLEQRLLAVAASGMSFSLSAGREPVVLEIETPGGGRVRAATPICFEATVPGVCRRLVFEGGRRRADVLVNITNDGWFGGWTPGREHHALASRWRCVELATPMVRSANTGISGAYDARGRVITESVTPMFEDAGFENAGDRGGDARDRVAGVVIADVAHGAGASVYARVGDLAGWVCVGLSAVGVAGAIRDRRRWAGAASRADG